MSLLTKSTKAAFAVVLAGATLAATVDSAEARWRGGPGGWRAGGWGGGVVRHHRGWGGAPAIAAGVMGLAAGAMIAGAASPAYSYPAYYGYSEPVYSGNPAYSVYESPGYYRYRPVYRRYVRSEPICTIRRKRVWLSSNTYTFRRVTTCR